MGHGIETELEFWSVQPDARWLPAGSAQEGKTGVHAVPEGSNTVIGLIVDKRSICLRQLMRAERGVMFEIRGRVQSAATGDVASIVLLDECTPSARRAAHSRPVEEEEDLPDY